MATTTSISVAFATHVHATSVSWVGSQARCICARAHEARCTRGHQANKGLRAKPAVKDLWVYVILCTIHEYESHEESLTSGSVAPVWFALMAPPTCLPSPGSALGMSLFRCASSLWMACHSISCRSRSRILTMWITWCTHLAGL